MRMLIRTTTLAAALAALLPSTPAAAQAPAPQPPSITVTATGSVQIQPDQATLQLAVETTAKDAKDAASSNAAKMQRVTQALRRLGVPADHVRTVGYDLSPQYADTRRSEEPDTAGPRITGYRAANVLVVTLDDLSKVGQAIDSGIDAGANRVASLEFGAKDPAPSRLEALRQAMSSARAQAQAMAEAAGETLGGLLNASTGEGPRPIAYARAESMAPMAQKTPIEAGELTVTATVVATFAVGGAR